MFGFSDAVFAGRPGFGNFTNAAGVAQGLGHVRITDDRRLVRHRAAGRQHHRGRGRRAGDCLRRRGRPRGQPLPSSPDNRAKGFYACYAALWSSRRRWSYARGAARTADRGRANSRGRACSRAPTVFLLLLCNDKEVLGPWVNSKKLNIFTAAVIWALVVLSVDPHGQRPVPRDHRRSDCGSVGRWHRSIGLLAGLYLVRQQGAVRGRPPTNVPVEWQKRETWRMPALNRLAQPVMSTQRKVGLATLRGYLVVAFALVVVKVVEVAVK